MKNSIMCCCDLTKKKIHFYTLWKRHFCEIVSSLYTIIWCACDEVVVVVLWQNIYRIKAKSMFHTELFFSAKKPICAPYFQLFNNLISEYVCVDFVLLFQSSTFPLFDDILERSVMLLIWQPRLKIAQRERKSTLCQVSRNIFATELSCEYDPTQKNSFAL